MIQKFIFDNPTALQLWDLTPIVREKIQASGERLDLLLGYYNNRYEIEVQLDATNLSHIIRTWDTERKRYPQYDYCAVIVAEEITAKLKYIFYKTSIQQEKAFFDALGDDPEVKELMKD